MKNIHMDIDKRCVLPRPLPESATWQAMTNLNTWKKFSQNFQLSEFI